MSSDFAIPSGPAAQSIPPLEKVEAVSVVLEKPITHKGIEVNTSETSWILRALDAKLTGKFPVVSPSSKLSYFRGIRSNPQDEEKITRLDPNSLEFEKSINWGHSVFKNFGGYSPSQNLHRLVDPRMMTPEVIGLSNHPPLLQKMMGAGQYTRREGAEVIFTRESFKPLIKEFLSVIGRKEARPEISLEFFLGQDSISYKTSSVISAHLNCAKNTVDVEGTPSRLTVREVDNSSVSWISPTGDAVFKILNVYETRAGEETELCISALSGMKDAGKIVHIYYRVMPSETGASVTSIGNMAIPPHSLLGGIPRAMFDIVGYAVGGNFFSGESSGIKVQSSIGQIEVFTPVLPPSLSAFLRIGCGSQFLSGKFRLPIIFWDIAPFLGIEIEGYTAKVVAESSHPLIRLVQKLVTAERDCSDVKKQNMSSAKLKLKQYLATHQEDIEKTILLKRVERIKARLNKKSISYQEAIKYLTQPEFKDKLFPEGSSAP